MFTYRCISQCSLNLLQKRRSRNLNISGDIASENLYLRFERKLWIVRLTHNILKSHPNLPRSNHAQQPTSHTSPITCTKIQKRTTKSQILPDVKRTLSLSCIDHICEIPVHCKMDKRASQTQTTLPALSDMVKIKSYLSFASFQLLDTSV